MAIKGKKVIAVIPARGGSKGISKKNIRLLNGEPLIYYQINNALTSLYIDKCIVTTDSDEIIDYVTQFNVEIRRRPKELAGDKITLDPVVFDAVNYWEEKSNTKADIVVTLQPTSPLLSSKTIDNAIKYLVENAIDTVISVREATHLYWKKNREGLVKDYKKRLNRQWLPKRYVETGGFLITRRSFVKRDSRMGNLLQPYVLNKIEGIDIDDTIDWLLAENLLKRLRFVFVVNGSKKLGLGHVYRSLNLAHRFIGHDISFITLSDYPPMRELIRKNGYLIRTVDKIKDVINTISEIRPNIVINDILDTKKEYIKQLKTKGVFVVNFEDLGGGADLSHLTINSLYEKTNPRGNHKFGVDYAILDERFYIYRPIIYKKRPTTLLILFGGTDPNNITLKTVRASKRILEKGQIKRILVVIGPGYTYLNKLRREINKLVVNGYKIDLYKHVENMPKIMELADIAISSNGRTIYELTAMGIPTISVSQNDRETLHLFARYHEGITYLGIACNTSEKDIEESILKVIKDNELRKRMYGAQMGMSRRIRSNLNNVPNLIIDEYERWKHEKNI